MFSKIIKKGANFFPGKRNYSAIGVGIGLSTATIASIAYLTYPKKKDNFWLDVFDHFQNETEHHHSLTFLPPTPKNVFRGSIEEIKRANLKGIKRVEICGPRLSKVTYDSSYKPSAQDMQLLLEKLKEQKIKEISFMGCDLTPQTGIIIGNALKDNNFVERLEVNSNQIGKYGLIAIIKGLEQNISLKVLLVDSYNIESYYWDKEELAALAQAISKHPSLEKVELPSNQLEDFADIRILLEPYLQAPHQKLPVISGLCVSKSRDVPPICPENMHDLAVLSTHRFARMY